MPFTPDWVIPSEIAVGPAPRKIEHFEILYSKKIKSILSLCSLDEASPPEDLLSKFDCRRVVLPDHSYERNITQEDILNTLNILEELKTKRATYIHCFAGVERSPLICIGWLMKTKNLPFDTALDFLMQAHPGTNPLPKQIKVLKEINF